MLAAAYQHIYHMPLMLVLLGCSAFFSTSETAFFNLSPRQIRQFAESQNRLKRLVALMLNRPKQLLNCLLFGNMTVNVLYYGTSSVLAIHLGEQIGLTAAAVAAFISFVVLVLAGEILPKSLAYANSKTLSVIAALPAFLCFKAFTPLYAFFNTLILEPVLRLLFGSKRFPKAITVAEFKALIETTRRRGLISSDENKLLKEVVELGFLKVRHVLRPRVDMISCALGNTPESVQRVMRENHLTKVAVYSGPIDNIVGFVHLRELLLKPGLSLSQLVQPVHFVPEQKTVESLLEFFHKNQTDIGIVVDEYGGIVGSVHLEDIVDELFGQPQQISDTSAIVQLGPFRYRLAGDMAVHDWAEAFCVDVEETRISTVGGLVTALLGKIPKAGDFACLGNLKFTVDKVTRHRIESLILTLEPLGSDQK
jgi:CBS domain containing-hemolysin-like protein